MNQNTKQYSNQQSSNSNSFEQDQDRAEDIYIDCQDCNTPFVFSIRDQIFYSDKQFADPKRCHNCRRTRKESNGQHQNNYQAPRNQNSRPQNSRGDNDERTFFDIDCAECGNQARVPFKPAANRPVYCRDCYKARAPQR